MSKTQILFVCTYNGTRARVAELYAKKYGGNEIEVSSASFEPQPISPYIMDIMNEVGMELTSSVPDSVFTRVRKRETFDYVVTMCDEASNEQCEVFMSNVETLFKRSATTLRWSVPAFGVDGSLEDKLAHAHRVRQIISDKVLSLLEQLQIPVTC
jgi:arsenate reductase